MVEGETGTLVDGRPYQDPVFRQQLLDYHEAAVQAHREHAKVEGVPIPVPPALALAPGSTATARSRRPRRTKPETDGAP